ncbi:hypothetical protein SDB94_15315, partial [Legionella pneumophila serogroup 1]
LFNIIINFKLNLIMNIITLSRIGMGLLKSTSKTSQCGYLLKTGAATIFCNIHEMIVIFSCLRVISLI